VVSERRAFGDRARRQRERRGVTLESIAQTTKVPASLFAGLERGDCSRWPGGVYSRAYVRAYAKAIGLDPNETVEDFTAAFSETVFPDGGAPTRRLRAAAALRLSMDDQPEVRQTRALRRVVIAGADLGLTIGLAWTANAFLGTSLWATVGVALAYQGCGRFFTDEPLLGWVLSRFRAATPPADEEAPVGEVTDVARTTA
jgi:transcriptional regulator with XRE-family HTH domain